MSNSFLFTGWLHHRSFIIMGKGPQKHLPISKASKKELPFPSTPKGKAAPVQCKVWQRGTRPCEGNCSQ